ncbi:SpoIIE family protein phosphatase [Tuwongella immobilis]|uniref:Response regulatory domain-containing protein n=1 Tax=Tuwongella immobilis TaxID=692036 RepID=A0A6C2YL01_9BACT|nr:SpoIIE family protein phosphatase [Tuwongella immobilis]VIP02258.1 response regulator : Serine phosphatase RsbU, regulator of sigma subunit OS=Singulisphaera acidiphila (strain ATCC BAA-1392 / DSM 18658 / VKM B-2454 / MOB10) GN=Sinac_4829 PE=4 SV=1: Response_reg: SpoIIE [Tuwongella immobilis]VTS00861.1 response regulator : Serine phosphatase RsbU, regulator of sigma subunit OS=Singulisphaera acidiphila (strain ATCC BAA-1392 / DSM 18658 / VKM B-2454 / MOB10) GN=Sinac_4829 PE=4 SV=1: Response_re
MATVATARSSASTLGPTSSMPMVVLLVDDQAIVGEAIRRMLAGESNLQFHFCSDPSQAIAMANQLQPTVILQDLVMPDIDGLTLVKFFRANPKTRDVPMIVLSSKEEAEVKAQAFAVGANDYLVKLPDKLELLARVKYHSKGYIATLERNEAYARLEESQRLLAEEVGQAAKYVASLLPEPLDDGRVAVDWRFVPSTQLGGDSFGYHWLDDDHFAVYLLDVSGHGVGSSLLSVSAMNVLRSQALPNTDFRDPGQVLTGLNNAFPMEKHGDKYFTIWYGVYRHSTRTLMYSGGGHPSGLLATGPELRAVRLQELPSEGPLNGMMPDLMFDTSSVELGPQAELFLFSDGVFEIEQPDGKMWQFHEFVEFMDGLAPGPSRMDRLHTHAKRLRGMETLNDDFSILCARFPSAASNG